jgi:hypothetical protein
LSLVLADLLASPKTFSATKPRTGDNRLIHQQLAEILRDQGDFEYPSRLHRCERSAEHCHLRRKCQRWHVHPDGHAPQRPVVHDGRHRLRRKCGNDHHRYRRGGHGCSRHRLGERSHRCLGRTAYHDAARPDVQWCVGRQQQPRSDHHQRCGADGWHGWCRNHVRRSNHRKAWATLKVLGLVTSAPPAQGANPTGIVTSPKGAIPHGLARRRSRL